MSLSNRISKATLFFVAAGLIPACNGSTNPNQNSRAPVFGGVASATPLAGSPGDVALSWTPAMDFSGTGITYNVFYAIGALPGNSGSETLQFSTTSATGVTVTGLTSSDPYIFHVEAQDGTGASDGNAVEVAATAP
jgi:hypothetical protein